MADLGSAVVGDGRNVRRRGDGIRQTADSVKTVGRVYDEVFGHDMVGVLPRISGSVDNISIDKGGVAAAVQECTGVGVQRQGYVGAAVGDDGQGGGVYLGDAVDGGVRIGGG